MPKKDLTVIHLGLSPKAAICIKEVLEEVKDEFADKDDIRIMEEAIAAIEEQLPKRKAKK